MIILKGTRRSRRVVSSSLASRYAYTWLHKCLMRTIWNHKFVRWVVAGIDGDSCVTSHNIVSSLVLDTITTRNTPTSEHTFTFTA
jgi:hypothetical protein